jgi:hypothetical protein
MNVSSKLKGKYVGYFQVRLFVFGCTISSSSVGGLFILFWEGAFDDVEIIFSILGDVFCVFFVGCIGDSGWADGVRGGEG